MGHHHHHHDSPPPPAPRQQHNSSPDSASASDAASASSISRAKKNSRRYPVDDGDGDVDRVECSGKYCRSCSAGMIADCVALCCCPCALVNLLTLALVKVPWMVGRKCLGLGNRKKINNQGQNGKSWKKCNSNHNNKKMTYCGSCSQRHRRCAAEEELPAQVSGYVIGFDDNGEEEEEDCVSSAERVWWELYQVGHLGFGRVSFSGGGSQLSKGNLGT